jgi:hypothetical protein
MWGDLFDERSGLKFAVAAGPLQRLLSRVWVPRDPWPYFTVSVLRFPQPEGLTKCSRCPSLHNLAVDHKDSTPSDSLSILLHWSDTCGNVSTVSLPSNKISNSHTASIFFFVAFIHCILVCHRLTSFVYVHRSYHKLEKRILLKLNQPTTPSVV